MAEDFDPLPIFTSSLLPEEKIELANTVNFAALGLGAVDRPINEKTTDIISVLDYGAVGDGITDDTVAFQNALNSNKIVLVPPTSASYRITEAIIIPSNTSLIGLNGRVVLKDETISGDELFTITNASNVSIKNLQINGENILVSGPSLSLTYKIVFSGASYCNISNVHFNIGSSGIQLTGTSHDNMVDEATFFNMAGTCIKIDTNSYANTISNIKSFNVDKFTVYMTASAVRNIVDNIFKSVDMATISSDIQTYGTQVDNANLRCGLEAIGITRTCQYNVISNVVTIGSNDNGISLSGDYNTLSHVIAINSAHDGIHIYGSYNNINTVTGLNSAFSGYGISSTTSESETTLASNNMASGIVATGNAYYGVEIKGASANNITTNIHATGNTLGDIRHTGTPTQALTNIFTDSTGQVVYDNSNVAQRVAYNGFSNTNTTLSLASATGAYTHEINSTTLSPSYYFMRSRGSKTAKTNTVVGDIIGELGFSAQRTLILRNTHLLQCVVSNFPSGTVVQSTLSFQTVNSSGAYWKYINMTHAGYVGIGNAETENTVANTPLHTIGEATLYGQSGSWITKTAFDSANTISAGINSHIQLDISGGGTLNDITTTAQNALTVNLTNINATSITITHNTAKIRCNSGASITLAQYQAVRFIRISANIFQQI